MAAGTDDFEMIRVQRKRAPMADVGGDEASGNARLDGPSHAIDAAESSGDDGDEKEKRVRGTFASTTAHNRRSIGSVMSSQFVVATGVLWCAVAGVMLFKWLWFYKAVALPLDKWLGPKLRQEGMALLVIIVIILPFVVSGLVYYAFRPESLRTNPSEKVVIVQKFRSWTRSFAGGRLDSTDVAVLLVFTLVQVYTLIGKLFIDEYNGKIAKDGYINRGGRALGMNGLYAVLISIVLVSRKSFVHEFLNLSSERAAKYHTWCGNFGAISLAVHGIIYIYCWYRDGKLAESLIPCFDCEVKQAYKSLRNFSGLFAQLVLMAVALASLEQVRRRHFRRFTFVHCLNVLFVVATCVHYYPAVFWFVAPMLVYVMHRVLSVFTRCRSSVVSARALDDAIIQLQLRRDGVGLGRQDFLPGQYVYIKVDEISKNEWHPISISSSPYRDRTTLSLDIKVQGPFTARLLQLVRHGSLSTVQVDGYYGTGIEIADTMVLVAGGSGMTPFLSLLEHLVLASASDPLPRRLCILWTARDMSLLTAHKPLLDQVRKSTNWETRVWLYWTSPGGIHDESALEGSDLGSKTLREEGEVVSGSAPNVSYASIFAGTVIGAVIGMALVLVVPSLSSAWWVKRLGLIVAGALGAMAGASAILWRALASRTGFERVDTAELDSSAVDAKSSRVDSADLVAVDLSRSRPDVASILREVHASCEPEDDVRVLVSGPSELQQRVAAVGACLRAPMVSVERRSFAL